MKTEQIKNAIEGHTPLPWEMKVGLKRVEIYAKGYYVLEIYFSDVTKAACLANAALIVHAVNSHAEVVAALESALNVLQATGARSEAQHAIEALAKAKGEQ